MQQIFRYLGCIIVGLVAYCTYFRNYENPPSFYWDENYHVTAAQKYLNHVFFMEPHPPLGKILIALGEDLFHANSENSQFLDTDYGKNPPPNFSFKGYRFFPALAGMAGALLFYLILIELSGSAIRSLLLSSLYLFDNAIIVHFRGAMLDSIQMFFILGTILLSLRVRNGARGFLTYLLIGVLFGAAVGTKANAVLIGPALIFALWYLRNSTREALRFLSLTALGAIVSTLLIWGAAFSLARVINPHLEHAGWYAGSEELKAEIMRGDRSPMTFFHFVRDSLKYSEQYHSKVPRLNLCKPDENGSFPLMWPIGARSINYRWQRDGESIKFLYLQVNPAIALLALLTVIGTISLFFVKLFGERRHTFKREDLLFFALVTYLLYLGATLSVDRVFYLYHYFIPLLFCHMMLVVLLEEMPEFAGIKVGDGFRNTAAGLIAIAAFLAFLAYSPLTYYQPITKSRFQQLSLLKLWDLIWVEEEKTNPIARPISDTNPEKKTTHFPKLELSGVVSSWITQDWGEPATDKTVEGNPLMVAGQTYAHGFGVHAISSVNFSLKGKFARFQASVGVPDEVAGTNAAVRFMIVGDGKFLFTSDISLPGAAAMPVDISVAGIDKLALQVLPAAEGKDNDHACWLDPKLIP